MDNRINRLARRISTESSGNGSSALFVPFLTAGFPDMDSSPKLFEALVESGADMIEVGIPFSDPLADGKAIQSASTSSLSSGTTMDSIFATAKSLRSSSEIPIILMGYFNPIFRRGVESFLSESVEAGVDGLIIPDLIPEESEEFVRLTRAAGLSVIYLVAPNTPDDRLKLIAEFSDDFIYCVTRYGVTGVQEALPEGLIEYLRRVRKITGRRILVGFGVGTPDTARTLAPHADGIVVGSAIIELISNGGNDIPMTLKKFCKAFKVALSGGGSANG